MSNSSIKGIFILSTLLRAGKLKKIRWISLQLGDFLGKSCDASWLRRQSCSVLQKLRLSHAQIQHLLNWFARNGVVFETVHWNKEPEGRFRLFLELSRRMEAEVRVAIFRIAWPFLWRLHFFLILLSLPVICEITDFTLACRNEQVQWGRCKLIFS
jgi:hypothetical protein